MKIDPGFPNHWKTQRLRESLGDAGVFALLQTWCNAQIRRQWSGLNLTPRRLAMETKWKGDENHLWQVFTDPEAPWLDKEDGGTWAIHGFEEHQSQVIHLWNIGGRGGRPKKVSPIPSSKKEEDTYSSSSTYPICKPNGNHMVSEVDEADAYRAIPTGNVPDMLQREKRVQSLKKDWKLPFTYAEQQVLMQNAKTLDAIDAEEWQTIKDWLFAKLPQGDATSQPRSRIKFLEWLPDVYRNAMAWRRKNPIQTQPAPRQTPAIAPPVKMTREQIAEMMKP